MRAHGIFAGRFFVDVVAEVNDEIEILSRHMFEGRVVAHLVVLARGECEAEAVRRGASGRHCAGAADRAQFAAGLEAIPVPAVGLETLGLDVYGMAPIAASPPRCRSGRCASWLRPRRFPSRPRRLRVACRRRAGAAPERGGSRGQRHRVTDHPRRCPTRTDSTRNPARRRVRRAPGTRAAPR